MEPILLPSRKSTISLQDITLHNWAKVTSLVVNKDQLGLVRPNLESLCEHQFHLPDSIVRAIVADHTIPVGYIRLQLEQQQEEKEEKEQEHENVVLQKDPPAFILLSFMIDQACQGLGFGTKAMLLLQKEILSLHGNHSIKVFTKPFEKVVVHPDDSPEHFFAGLGFDKSKDHSQDVMVWTSQS